MGFFDKEGVKGFKGLIGTLAQNRYDENQRQLRAAAMAQAIRNYAAAQDMKGRSEVMANYAGKGYNPNDLRFLNTKPDYSHIKSADGNLIDVRTGKSIYKAPTKPKEKKYSKYRNIGDNIVDLDTGEVTYRGEATAKQPKTYRVSPKFYEEFDSELKDYLSFDEDQELDPKIRRDVYDEANMLYQQTGNYPGSIAQAARNHGLTPNGKNYERYDSEGRFNPFVENKYYMRPKGYKSGITRKPSLDKNDPRVKRAMAAGYSEQEIRDFLKQNR